MKFEVYGFKSRSAASVFAAGLCLHTDVSDVDIRRITLPDGEKPWGVCYSEESKCRVELPDDVVAVVRIDVRDIVAAKGLPRIDN